MATIKRTTTTVSTSPSRALPPLPSRTPEIEQPIYTQDDNWAPEEPEQQPVSDVVTVGAEQLARSQEMEAMGVEEWKRQHDERDPDQLPQSVAGVGYAPGPGDTDGGFRSR